MNSLTTRLIHILFLSILMFASCKKDKLHFNKVIVLNSNTTNRLNAITESGGVIYIAGGERFYKCTVLVSRDGGNSWQSFDFPNAGKALYGITANKAGHIYACGYEAVLVWSTDSGYNWNFRPIGNWEPFKDLAFTGKNMVGIMGISYNSGGIAMLDSAGNILKYDSTKTEYNDIEMVTDGIGYIAGYGVILKTTDAGSNWSYQHIRNDNFTSIYALNENELWTCGVNGSIYHTSDGGYNWERKRNGNDLTKTRYNLYDIVFADAANGWAVGENGLVIQSNDGGNTWKEYQKFTSNTLRSIIVLKSGDLLVCGDGGGIYKLQR